jgi:phosphoglucosamine mutase
MNQRKYFGTDGIRGRVGQWPISADFMLRLGRALGVVLTAQKKTPGRPLVLIGKDTRVSGYMFESALEAGLAAACALVRSDAYACRRLSHAQFARGCGCGDQRIA